MNKRAGWTPGPWHSVDNSVGEAFQIIQPIEWTPRIATVANAPNDKANARLIAAAPELYEALQLCAAVTDSFLNGQSAVTEAEMDAALSAANAAIAKAWRE